MEDLTKYDYKKKQYRMLLIVSMLLFMVILLFSIFWNVNYNKKYSYFVAIDAVVVGYDDSSGEQYAVISYCVDAVEYQKTTNKTGLDKGDKITIFYDENDPVGFIYNRDIKYYVLPIISALFGVVNLMLFVLYYVTYEVNSDNKKILKAKAE